MTRSQGSQLHTVTSHEDLNSGREMAEIEDTKQVSVVSLIDFCKHLAGADVNCILCVDCGHDVCIRMACGELLVKYLSSDPGLGRGVMRHWTLSH